MDGLQLNKSRAESIISLAIEEVEAVHEPPDIARWHPGLTGQGHEWPAPNPWVFSAWAKSSELGLALGFLKTAYILCPDWAKRPQFMGMFCQLQQLTADKVIIFSVSPAPSAFKSSNWPSISSSSNLFGWPDRFLFCEIRLPAIWVRLPGYPLSLIFFHSTGHSTGLWTSLLPYSFGIPQNSSSDLGLFQSPREIISLQVLPYFSLNWHCDLVSLPQSLVWFLLSCLQRLGQFSFPVSNKSFRDLSADPLQPDWPAEIMQLIQSL